jgi:predicted ATP-dependent serine protease
MIHGAPGAGKSTLLGQCAGSIPQSVYVSAEESQEQVAARFVRLGYSDQLCAASRDISETLAMIGNAPFAIIDSISRYKKPVEAAEMVVEHAQRYRNAIVLVVHATKGNVHAGPRKLEHLIDCSLSLLREDTGARILVVEKNRFGPAPLAYKLAMTEKGLM